MATGLGKTAIFTHMERKGRVLILSHRDELVRQPLQYYDCSCGVEEAEEHSNGKRWCPQVCRAYGGVLTALSRMILIRSSRMRHTMRRRQVTEKFMTFLNRASI